MISIRGRISGQGVLARPLMTNVSLSRRDPTGHPFLQLPVLPRNDVFEHLDSVRRLIEDEPISSRCDHTLPQSLH